MKRRYILVLSCAAAITASLAALSTTGAAFGGRDEPKASDLVKTQYPGEVVSFTAEDFENAAGGDLSGIIISSLPDEQYGRLVYSGREVKEGSVVSAASIGALSFVPGGGGECLSTFDYTPIFTGSGAAEDSATVSISLSERDNSAPIAQNASYETYCDLPLASELSSVDPDGDEVSYEITSQPQYGTVSLDGSSFVYTASTGREKDDSFTFTATDSRGLKSDAATVTVSLIKRSNSDSLSYSDMAQSPAHYAAVKLAEAGVLRGESIGAASFLYPDEEVSRAQFVSMVSKVYSMPLPTAAVVTGMGDNSEIPRWAQPCVAAALSCQIVNGEVDQSGNRVFRASDPVTKAEAAVIFNRLLGLANDGRTPDYTDADSIPSWAEQAVVNTVSAGYMELESDGAFHPSQPMTREDAAAGLYKVMTALESDKDGFFDILN